MLSAAAAVSMEMKECYLDWSYSTGGYKKARKTFTRWDIIKILNECETNGKKENAG